MITKSMNVQMQPRIELYWSFMTTDRDMVPRAFREINISKYKKRMFEAYPLWETIIIDCEGLTVEPGVMRKQRFNVYEQCHRLFWTAFSNLVQNGE